MADDIKRVPVTKKKSLNLPADYHAGMKSPGVLNGPINKDHEQIGRIKKHAAVAGMFGDQGDRPSVGLPRMAGAKMQELASGGAGGAGGAGGSKTAGMMMNNIPASSSNYFAGGNYLDAFRSSYASGSQNYGGTYDIPTYFVLMNLQNGGLLYWPTTLREKYEWYRYWVRTDAYVGRAMELLSDLPMSRITLNMPKVKGMTKSKYNEILDFYKDQVETLGLFEKLQYALWEYNMIGNVYAFHEWDDENKRWKNMTFLPPEEVASFDYPFSDESFVEYRPERLIQLINTYSQDGGWDNLDPISKGIIERMPKELVEMIKDKGAIILDTDPMSGSFVKHMARRKSPYHDLGASVLERVLVPMLQKEHYRYTQLSLASRNMTPKNLISAPNLMPDEVDELRAQVDLSYMDPDYSIVVNYEVNWEMLGADNRLLELTSEYERIENQVFAAMGVTRELLTGEGQYSGSKITVEIMNTMFLIVRDLLQNYVEQSLFKPIAEAKGWFSEDKNGVKQYWYPKLGFNRLTIRDNAEVFDSLFQLYQKGSLPVDVIYELFNLNSDDLHDRIYDDLFTVKDPNFNRVVEEISSEVGRGLVERSDIMDKFAKYFKVELSEEEEGEGDEGGFGGGFGDEGDGAEEEGGFGEEPAEDTDTDAIAQEVADELPPNASDDEIAQAVNKKVSGE